MSEKCDWHGDEIMPNSVIGGTYKNTHKARHFFKVPIGERFKLNRSFMAWMIDNRGAIMGDAVNKRQRRNSGK